MLTILLTIGIISIDVGKLTIKPIANARIHFSKKSGTKPKFIKVRTRDIEKDIPNDNKTPNKIVEYFLFTLTIGIIPNGKITEGEQNKH